MNRREIKLRTWALIGLAGSLAVALLITVGVALEYYYAKNYFSVQYAWHTISFPWNHLSFMFFVRAGSPQSESTLLIAASCGASGALAWFWMAHGHFSRGLACALATTFFTSWVTSSIARSAVFSELLVLHLCQTLGVIAFCTGVRTRKAFTRRGGRDDVQTRFRFSLRAILALTGIIAGMLAAAALIDSHGVREVLIAPYYRINVWLPLLGCAIALITLVFAVSCEATGWVRFLGLAFSTLVLGASVLGSSLAAIYPKWPVLWSTYYGSYAPGTFRYFPQAYAVWLPLLGVFLVTTLAALRLMTSASFWRTRNAKEFD